MKKYIFLFLSILFLLHFELYSQITINRQTPQAKRIEQKVFTEDDMLNCIRISEPKVSPDGKWVLYKKGIPNISANKMNNEIFVVSINGANEINISNNEKSDYNALWSPNGKKIAFLSTRDGKPQIYIADFPDGEIKKITNIERGVNNLNWSPDGKHFSFTTDVKMEALPQEKYTNLSNVNVRIYEKLPIRHWDEWNDEYYQHLFILPVEGGEPIDLIKDEKFETPLKPWGGTEQIAWSPDGKEIAYTSKKVEDFATSTNSDIFIYSLSSGTTKNITEGMPGFDRDPLYSPDGKWIAFHSQERAGFESDRIRLMLYKRKSGEIKELSKTIDNWIESSVWSPDSKYLYSSVGIKGTIQIFKINVDDGKYEAITEGKYNFGPDIDITPDSKTLVFTLQTMQKPPEIYKMQLSEKVKQQLTKANDNAFEKFKSVEIQERWIRSIDGKKVHCWVIYPPDFDSTKKYPMITFCQGGPQNMISQVFHYRWNFYTMASHGYVVVAPNRRGCPGFGQNWVDAISQDWGGLAMQDILFATDEIASESYIDKNALAAVGASAGGYATFWLAGNHNNRFKAFVSHSGVFNLESMYGSTEELWFTNWDFGGPYWENENKKVYEFNSPHNFAQYWNTPILISCGGFDYRVPETQSFEAFTLAQTKGIPSKLIYFPEQNHLIVSLQEAIFWYHEYFEFLDKYCMNVK